MNMNKKFQRILNELDFDENKYNIIRVFADSVLIERNSDHKRDVVRY